MGVRWARAFPGVSAGRNSRAAKPAHVLLICVIPVVCRVQGLSQLSATQPWVIRAGGQ